MPHSFVHIVSMRKPFDVRKEDDRIFCVGDELLLREFVPKGDFEADEEEYYTGAICHRVITYILKISEEHVVLGLARK